MSAWRDSHSQQARQLLPLLAGVAALVLAVFVLALGTAKSLAELHVRHKLDSLAQQAAHTWRTQQPDKAKVLLEGLMRFRDVEAMSIAAGGRLLWAAPAGWQAKADDVRFHAAAPDGIERRYVEARKQVQAGDSLLTVSLKLDITGIVASYRAIALLMAKVVSSVLIAAFLVIGLLILKREKARTAAAAPDMERLHDGMVRRLRAQAARMRASLDDTPQEAQHKQRRAG